MKPLIGAAPTLADDDEEDAVDDAGRPIVAAASPASMFGAPSKYKPLKPGNIDLAARPKVRNADGSVSTVRSMSANIDGMEVLIPTVSDDGRLLSDSDAIALYKRTGRHLGMFRTPDEATGYAQDLHKQQEAMYTGAVSSVGSDNDDEDAVDDSGQQISSGPIIARSQAPQPASTSGAGADLDAARARLDAEKANSPRSVLGWLGNVPSSGLKLLEGGYQMVRHPLDTVSALGSVALGGVQKAATAAGADPDRNGKYDRTPVFDAFVEQMKKRYGGLDAIGNTIYEDPAGAALDLSGLLSGGSSVLASRMPRTAEFLASAAKAVDPIAAMGKGARAAGRTAARFGKGYLGISTGTGREVISTAAHGSDAFKAGMRGAITHEDVLDQVHDAITQLVERRRDNYRAQLAQLPQQVVIDLRPVHQTMKDSLKRFSIRVVPTRGPSQLTPGLVPNAPLNAALPVPNSMIIPGKVTAFDLDFSRSALRHSPQEMAKVRAAFDDLATWGARAGDTSPLGVDLLKQGLSEMVAANPGRGDAIVKTVHDRTRTLLEQQVPGYRELTSEYASASKFLDEVNSELSVGRSAKPGAGIRKLSNALNQRSDYRRHLIETLDVSFGTDIKGAIAGLEMQPIAPRGLIGPMAVGAGGTALFSKLSEYMSDPSKLMMALSGAATFSPRLVGETLAAIATARNSAAMRATGDTVGLVRRVVFNPATYRFVEEGTDAAGERKQQLDEMGKYLTGKSKGGSGTSAVIPPPPSVLPGDASPTPAAPSLERPNRSGLTEWPKQEGELDENDAMLMQRAPGGEFPTPVLPSMLLPAHFKHARQTAWGTPLDKTIPADQKASGRFGLEFDLKKRRSQRELANTVLISADAAGRPNVYAHELGHVAYEFDVPQEVKRTFQRMTNKVLMDMTGDLRSNGPLPKDPEERLAAFERLTGRYPKAIVFNFLQHSNDRAALYHESFAELFGQYMVNPSAFKSAYPGFYGYFKSSVFRGREYIGSKKRGGETLQPPPKID